MTLLLIGTRSCDLITHCLLRPLCTHPTAAAKFDGEHHHHKSPNSTLRGDQRMHEHCLSMGNPIVVFVCLEVIQSELTTTTSMAWQKRSLATRFLGDDVGRVVLRGSRSRGRTFDMNGKVGGPLERRIGVRGDAVGAWLWRGSPVGISRRRGRRRGAQA